MRGLRTVLVEQRDLAWGTSSRSSRLVHGGIRYLEHGDFKLVFEALRERAVLERIAPHLVRPLPFIFPLHDGDRLPLLAACRGHVALRPARAVPQCEPTPDAGQARPAPARAGTPHRTG